MQALVGALGVGNKKLCQQNSTDSQNREGREGHPSKRVFYGVGMFWNIVLKKMKA
jgi:hypothetical protein